MKKGGVSEPVIAAYEQVPERLRFPAVPLLPIDPRYGAGDARNAGMRMLLSVGAWRLEQGNKLGDVFIKLWSLDRAFADIETQHLLKQHLRLIRSNGFEGYQEKLLGMVVAREQEGHPQKTSEGWQARGANRKDEKGPQR